MESIIDDLKEMKLLKQREIEWIDRRIEYFKNKIKNNVDFNSDTDDGN